MGNLDPEQVAAELNAFNGAELEALFNEINPGTESGNRRSHQTTEKQN